MARLLILFNRPKAELLADVKHGAAPDELVYGTVELGRRGWETITTDDGFGSGLSSFLWMRLVEDPFSAKGLRVGLNVPQAWRLRDRMRSADLVFATGDAAALGALAIKRRLGIDTPLVAGSIGLVAGLAERPGRLTERISRSLLGQADRVVCYSRPERQALTERIGLAAADVRFIPFGVDAKLHRPAATGPQGPVLAFGNDRRRDWATLCKAAGAAGIELDLVTYPEYLEGLSLPEKVNLIRGPLPFAKLDELVERARFIVLPIVPNDYTAAQISLLYSMARGKATIVSATAPLDEGYGIEHENHALLVRPQDADALADAMQRLDADDALCESLGARGRRLVEDRLNIERYVDDLEALFGELL